MQMAKFFLPDSQKNGTVRSWQLALPDDMLIPWTPCVNFSKEESHGTEICTFLRPL